MVLHIFYRFRTVPCVATLQLTVCVHDVESCTVLRCFSAASQTAPFVAALQWKRQIRQLVYKELAAEDASDWAGSTSSVTRPYQSLWAAAGRQGAACFRAFARGFAAIRASGGCLCLRCCLSWNAALTTGAAADSDGDGRGAAMLDALDAATQVIALPPPRPFPLLPHAPRRSVHSLSSSPLLSSPLPTGAPHLSSPSPHYQWSSG